MCNVPTGYFLCIRTHPEVQSNPHPSLSASRTAGAGHLTSSSTADCFSLPLNLNPSYLALCITLPQFGLALNLKSLNKPPTGYVFLFVLVSRVSFCSSSGMSDGAVDVEGETDRKSDMVLKEGEAVKQGADGDRKRKEKRKRKLLKEAKKAKNKGVCYLSRVPPKMDPLKVRQLLSQYGEIERIYLSPEDSSVRIQRKQKGGFRGQGFSEGWVEFTDKRVAKRTASMLNGEQIGGRKRSQFFYDLWNIKYLSKFKWDDLTAEIAYKNAVREQKLAMETSVAKKERDFYLAKVDQSRALSAIEERLTKKQKTQEGSKNGSDPPVFSFIPKVTRQVPQTRLVQFSENKPKLSREVLAGVFNNTP